MRRRDEADVLEGPEPPVALLRELDPRDPVPPGLDRAVLADIKGRLRRERPAPWWRRTGAVAALSAAAAAVVAVAVTLAVLQRAGDDAHASAAPSAMSARGHDDATGVVHLDFLVQHPDAEPDRLAPGDVLRVGDGVYLRAEMTRPGTLTFLAAGPDGGWERLVTMRGSPGPNDLQKDGRLQVFYVDEAGPYRFAAVVSEGRPPDHWNPGTDDAPRLDELGHDAEVAWIVVEAHR